MSVHLPDLHHLSVIKPLPEKRYCPACHRVIAYVVPAETLTYVIHGEQDICVIENRVVANG